MTRRRWLLVGSTLFFVLGLVAGLTWTDTGGVSRGPGAPSTGPGAAAVADPAARPGADPGGQPEPLRSGNAGWLRPLAPAERAPQLVLLAVEGTPTPGQWRRMTDLATTTGAGLTVFLPASAIGDAHESRRSAATPGRDSPVIRALDGGHEVGLLVRGGDCGSPRHPADSGAVIRRAVAQLEDLGGPDGRSSTPPGALPRCEEALFPSPNAGDRIGYTVWSHATAPRWPARQDGRWALRALDLGHDRTGATTPTEPHRDPGTATASAAPDQVDVRDLHASTRDSNRAPLVLTTRAAQWSDERFVSDLRKDLAHVCLAEETVCATLAEAVEWLDLQNRDTLAAYRRTLVAPSLGASGVAPGSEAGRAGG
ncbi:hypothetical protein, partial [Actinoalloteichus spitiensis]|uniref:hypothetical protein n=1 Tax=Actinoalloteichus spitiensis TaxID=252394 RepID=UPI00037412DF